MVDEGVLEVTLLGQNVNAYGRHAAGGERASFAELLHALDAVDGLERIRYTSPHPQDMREDVVVAHASSTPSARTSTCRCSRAPRGS